ncbi:hypothetical protein SAMN05421813_14213 [Daejeonella rubra]|uniref:Uncharacterized protein n=1 Tax=Daejeonella rubra TaxID=990371 RepID=A0A1G9YQX6_9SPHI|nr:hypothetical protein SAMN05421813_14213 [Daejeonella rubra]
MGPFFVYHPIAHTAIDSPLKKYKTNLLTDQLIKFILHPDENHRKPLRLFVNSFNNITLDFYLNKHRNIFFI